MNLEDGMETLAKTTWAMYIALVKEGFMPEQALALCGTFLTAAIAHQAQPK